MASPGQLGSSYEPIGALAIAALSVFRGAVIFLNKVWLVVH